MRHHGFSLVELSIVLVILGLLTGGILAGQSMIHAAELRSVITDAAKYKTAIYSFRDKYFGLPGDITNATSIWGADAACPGTYNTVSNNGTTCNGDGNGQISISDTSREYFRSWQQLADAQLITGNYSGIGASGTYTSYDAQPGLNIPPTRISNGGFFLTYAGSVSGNASYFDGDYGNFFLIGATNSGTSNSNPLFSAEEVWQIDTKVDDGKPGYGTVTLRKSYTSCFDSADQYNLDDNGINCVIHYKSGV